MRFAIAVITLLAGNAVLAQSAQQPVPGDLTLSEKAASSTNLPQEQLSQEDLSQRSDTELTALTAQWSQLSPEQRRRLLAEVRGRMVNSRQARRPQGVVVQRRYGRVVRKSDGSVVVQTRVVQIRPRQDPRISASGKPNSASGKLNHHETAQPRVTFGIGFEQRTRRPEQVRVTEQAPGAENNTNDSSVRADVDQPTVVISQESPLSSNR
ncbi:MAG: hypothetical protein NXH95_05730 [Pseudomonadaceae bacterium]|nr:hypothetical protein [Pseudomonadaceae bacterium]